MWLDRLGKIRENNTVALLSPLRGWGSLAMAFIDQSSRGVLPEGGVLGMFWGFPGAYLCMSVILIKLQSGFIEIMLLCWCSPVGLLHAWGHLPWRTPLEDCF